jgi:transcription elongation factor GreA
VAAPMIPQFVRDLEAKVKVLEFELTNELPKEIQRARELGDLSENAEYAAAKERQDLVSAQIGQYKKRLADLRMIDFSKVRRDAIGLGSTVVVVDVNTGDEITYELVASEEADVPNGKISTTSPIGRGLMSKVDGDSAAVVTPGGTKEFEIVSFKTVHEK